MNDLWKPVFALAAAIWLGACADNPAQPVCGEGGVGFMVQRWPVNGLDVHQVLAELGSNYVVVDPSCRFTVYDATDGHIGAAVEGQLTDDQAAELSAFLALQEWEGLEDFYGLTVCDGSNFRFAWGDRTLALAPACGASGTTGSVPTPADDVVRRLGVSTPSAGGACFGACPIPARAGEREPTGRRWV